MERGRWRGRRGRRKEDGIRCRLFLRALSLCFQELCRRVGGKWRQKRLCLCRATLAAFYISMVGNKGQKREREEEEEKSRRASENHQRVAASHLLEQLHMALRWHFSEPNERWRLDEATSLALA